LTGKGREFGGSLIRPEATGYGNIYFLLEMLKTRNIDIKLQTITSSSTRTTNKAILYHTFKNGLIEPIRKLTQNSAA
jgi:hypothetical protein